MQSVCTLKTAGCRKILGLGIYYRSGSRLDEAMKIRCLLLMPSESLARGFDEGYARLIDRMRRRIEGGDRRPVLYSRLAYAEHTLPFVVGAMASYFGFVIVVPLVLCLYPLWSMGMFSYGTRFMGNYLRGWVTGPLFL